MLALYMEPSLPSSTYPIVYLRVYIPDYLRGLFICHVTENTIIGLTWLTSLTKISLADSGFFKVGLSLNVEASSL
jgi:hypothetical protein